MAKKEQERASCSPERPMLHLTHIGKAPRARVARIAAAALDHRTSLDPAAVEATIAAIQAVLPDIVNTALSGFTVRPGPGGTEQTCVGHACTGYVSHLDTPFPDMASKCKEEACNTQACSNHNCGTNACGTQNCPSASCASNAPPPNDNIFDSEAFIRVRERLERLTQAEEGVQSFSISVESTKLDTSEE